MAESGLQDRLILFGLTRQEANIYVCLFLNEDMTGYEVAKQTGISRSNVYSGLSGLVDKGAAYVREGTSVRYTAVPIEEFCDNKIRIMQMEKDYLLKNLPNKNLEAEGYFTIEGYHNIVNKVLTMLTHAQKRIYLSAESEFITGLRMEINQLIQRNIKVVLLTDKMIALEESDKTYIYQTKAKKNQIRLIMDSQYVLTGDISGNHHDTCLYCGQPNFVNVFKEAMRNEIKLIELTKGEDTL